MTTLMYTLFLCKALMTSLCQEVASTVCSDAILTENDQTSKVINMCEGSTVTSSRVVINTHNQNIYKSCMCAAKILGVISSNTEVTVKNYGNTSPDANCRSYLKITSTSTSNFATSKCDDSFVALFGEFKNADNVTMTLSRDDESSPWKSGYCIWLFLQKSDPNTELNVTCSEGMPSSVSTATTTEATHSTTTTITTTAITTTTTTTVNQPNVHNTRHTTSQTTTTTVNQPNVHNTRPTASQTTTSLPLYMTTQNRSLTTNIRLEIIIGASAGGVVLIIMVIIVIVVVHRKKNPDTGKHLKHISPRHEGERDVPDDIQPYSTTNDAFSGNGQETVSPMSLNVSAGLQDPEISRIVTPNSLLYVSAGPRDPKTTHIVTGTGDSYAQVEKTSKRRNNPETGKHLKYISSLHEGDRHVPDDIQPYSTTNDAFSGNGQETVFPMSLNVSAGPQDPEISRIVTPNSLYVSAGPQDPETIHIVTGTGDVYAQVQKASKRSETNNPVNDETESPQGAVYAVVNKPKKTEENSHDTSEDDKLPSQYKNRDGLVFLEVDVEKRSSRKRSPPAIKPKMADRVVYSDVL